MSWNLFLDDERIPYYVDPNRQHAWRIAPNLTVAKYMVQTFGMPYFISFDHDLGSNEDAMMFLRWLAYEFFDEKKHTIPNYQIHSANPEGCKNIDSFMKSWKKSQGLP
jgi:hypothetical protein